eukprot:174691-Prorocentrum_minimum.AAC.1
MGLLRVVDGLEVHDHRGAAEHAHMLHKLLVVHPTGVMAASHLEASLAGKHRAVRARYCKALRGGSRFGGGVLVCVLVHGWLVGSSIRGCALCNNIHSLRG